MRIALFYHSLVSDWNHGNAHFLRGVAGELIARGHEVRVYEPVDAWSARHLVEEHGEAPVRDFRAAYPALASTRYDPDAIDLERELDGVDLVVVHEWNTPELVRRIGEARARSRTLRVLFHDTHHRSVTQPGGMAGYELSQYDGVLAFGQVVRDMYVERGWAARAWTWHEAADARVFRPVPAARKEGDLVWVGNWGDGERSRELGEFLIEPVRTLGLKARVYGVRYPEEGRAALAAAGIEYRGWLPNYRVPEAFGAFRVTLHVPRQPYARALPGIPTIRVFEALACGIPLVTAPWHDAEGLFAPGEDFLVASNGEDMKKHLKRLLADADFAREIAEHGRRTVLARHTCAHRVDELLAIYASIETREGAARA